MVSSLQCQGEVEENMDKTPSDQEAPAGPSESQISGLMGLNILRADYSQILLWQIFSTPFHHWRKQTQRGQAKHPRACSQEDHLYPLHPSVTPTLAPIPGCIFLNSLSHSPLNLGSLPQAQGRGQHQPDARKCHYGEM